MSGTFAGSNLRTSMVDQESKTMNARVTENARRRPASMPSGFGPDAGAKRSAAMTALLAALFALYVKTKNFHWHVSGPHFRDYHLLLDEQSEQIFATTDAIAERVRKIGGVTLHSIGQVAKLQRVIDSDAGYVTPMNMLAELREDNKQLTAYMRETHAL